MDEKLDGSGISAGTSEMFYHGVQSFGRNQQHNVVTPDLSSSCESEYNESQAESLPEAAIQSDLSTAYLQDRSSSSMPQEYNFEDEEDIENYITPSHLNMTLEESAEHVLNECFNSFTADHSIGEVETNESPAERDTNEEQILQMPQGEMNAESRRKATIKELIENIISNPTTICDIRHCIIHMIDSPSKYQPGLSKVTYFTDYFLNGLLKFIAYSSI